MLLAEDLRLLHDQLQRALEDHPSQALLLAHIEDLQARFVALNGDLRRIAALLGSPLPENRSFEDAVRELAEAFMVRTGVATVTRFDGDLQKLTETQQLTLLALVREALSNVREHSDAQNAEIMVSAADGTIEATVQDDGRGFEPEIALVQAARDGHLGLVGMHERVQMLGGVTRIDSRRGGPTVISVRLPAGLGGRPVD